jgi:hypothetical protein
LSAYTQKDYEAIEGAVLESPRGRWFLGEFARRNRAADTLMLLEAIRKLERGVAENSADQLSADLAAELQDVSETIASTIDRGAGGDELPKAVDRLARIKEKIDGLLARRFDMGQGELTGENLSFFAGDEDLFESAPAASAPSLSVVGEPRSARCPPARPRGAKGRPEGPDRLHPPRVFEGNLDSAGRRSRARRPVSARLVNHAADFSAGEHLGIEARIDVAARQHDADGAPGRLDAAGQHGGERHRAARLHHQLEQREGLAHGVAHLVLRHREAAGDEAPVDGKVSSPGCCVSRASQIEPLAAGLRSRCPDASERR